MTDPSSGPVPLSHGRFAAVRLCPGDDLTAGLRRVLHETGARAMAVVTCVGSLTRVEIRHANRPEGTLYQGHFEITSLTGTIDPVGEHLHLTITDGEGRAFGGHLLPGSSVYTTAEIVTVLLDDLAFGRAPCPLSGYDELSIHPQESA
ncbi:PPC domain-containing DNA-binding protein [Paenirhodobacter sp.]|uniref:PPC domain-containing DNA-binding protein n=1 Tax=Paenirhodobacter sp. TaxID=1965326 RepID=UPI003B3F2D5C